MDWTCDDCTAVAVWYYNPWVGSPRRLCQTCAKDKAPGTCSPVDKP